jgi:hypothetical protein
LTRYTSHLVTDQTEIEGEYDIALNASMADLMVGSVFESHRGYPTQVRAAHSARPCFRTPLYSTLMGARQRWPAFSFSLLLHIGAVALISWIDISFAPPASPHYNVLPVPEKMDPDEKIIWYKMPKAVPEVTPDKRFGPADRPQGIKDPSRTLIVVAPHAESTHQVIRQPDQPKPLPNDVPVPNLVSIAVKLPPKVYVAAPVATQAPTVAPTVIDAPPVLNVTKPQTANALGALASLQKLPPKVFVAPAAGGAITKAGPQVAMPDASALDGQSAPVTGLQAVMLGLNPGNTLPPPGSRSGQIARAPDSGTPSSGVLSGSGAIVPGVLSHGKPGELTIPAPVPPTPPIVVRKPAQEIVLPPVNRTMSAPLRPSSRVIPPAIEAKFTRRDVYTLVIPGPTLPNYGGNWVLWFAEADPSDIESRNLISAPLPARKYSMPDEGGDAAEPAGAADIQFSAVIDKAGHIGSPVVLGGSRDPAMRHRALEELGSWEFKPALRNGQPVNVDAVIDIPFKFQSAASALH